MFDSHCHLNFKAFHDDAGAVANAMANNRVMGLVVGCDSTSSQSAINLAKSHSNLYASVGLHPTHVLDDPWDDSLMKELALEQKVVAIGEVGLDFYRFPAEGDRQTYIDAQYEVFRSAIALAKQLDLPLVIHARESYDELIAVLAEYQGLRGTVHCFMGNRQQAEKLLDMGFHLGFTGVITYADADTELLSVIETMPLNRLLIETDAPYLTPEPYRTEGKKNSGKIPRNLPQYTLEVAKKIGELRNLRFMEVVGVTETNALALFKIGSPWQSEIK